MTACTRKAWNIETVPAPVASNLCEGDLVVKLFAAGLAVCALTLSAQQNASGQLKHLSVPTITSDRPVSISAREIEKEVTYPSVIRLKGSIEIQTPVCVNTKPADARTWVCDGSVVLRADEAVLHEDTGQVEASGNVRVTRERSNDPHLGR
jgi:lipopolysaccharide assembly outer membrane protein LptD (OstA)